MCLEERGGEVGYRRGGRRRADRGLGSPLGLWAQKERRAWGQRVHTMKVPGWGFRCGLEAFKGGMGGGGGTEQSTAGLTAPFGSKAGT